MFDDHQERAENWPHDRFAAIRKFFELFNKNCLKHVIPSEYLAIDETFYPMRNQISIKQYNPNKPAKYGLLFKSLNAGKPKQGEGPYYIEGVDMYIKTLVEKNRFKVTSARRKYIKWTVFIRAYPLQIGYWRKTLQ